MSLDRNADSAMRRFFILILRLMIIGALAFGYWIGWENFIPLCFVLLVVYGVARAEHSSTQRGYGPGGQK